ncbi:MAG: GFA family protein [Proteobacteria bacterium]|nr:GFA family protein [Pseudomonadota bacterium]
MENDVWSGGCQCGAVRFHLLSPPGDAYLCHCRMCQKQMAGPFAAWVDMPREAFRISRGALSYFQSSDTARRGFCAACGTPLTFEFLQGPQVTVAIGAFDRHAEIIPRMHYGIEAREAWTSDLDRLPAEETGEGAGAQFYTTEKLDSIQQSSRQHPDHDTDRWPAD